MSTSSHLYQRYTEIEQSISVLLAAKESLSLSYGLRHTEEAPTHSLGLLENELSLKQHELEELQTILHIDSSH